MAVDVSTKADFSAGAPRLLFTGDYVESPTATKGYDVSADGRRFLRIQLIEPNPPGNQIQVVTNWFEELKGQKK